MHKLNFFPLGNADSIRIDLENGKKILFDFGNQRNSDDEDDLRCDLEKELREDLEDANRNHFDIVAFTHLDADHFQGATKFFWLDHDKEYQDDDRIKISTLWVPAAVLTEETLEHDEAKALQKEAQHRFRQGTGIRIFSRPGRLEAWCKDNGVDFEGHKHLITDAGKLVPDLTHADDGVEFFVHSPFATRLNETEVEDRNEDAIVVNASFNFGGETTKVFLMADTGYKNLADIVKISEAKGNSKQLEFDVCKLPHHCSYKSLGEDKGKDITDPDKDVRRLYEEYGLTGSVIISTSKPIPSKGSSEDEDKQPPHRQAANFYKEEVLGGSDSEFIVTMEHPKKSAPEPLVIQIDGSKATIEKRALAVGAAIVGTRAPRAGAKGR